MNSLPSASSTPIQANKSSFRKALYSTLWQIKQDELKKFSSMLTLYSEQIEVVSKELFEKLDLQDQSTFVQWFLFRWGYISILDQTDLNTYRANVEKFINEPKEDVDVAGKTLKRINCASQGYDFNLVQYDFVCGVHDIFYNQYEHGSVAIAPGDVIIDAGAFIGDTAALFNYKSKGDCTLHSFELLDENIELYKINAAQNNIGSDRYTINKLALSDVSGQTLYISRNQHQGATSIRTGEQGDETIDTISIDDYAQQHRIKKLDFIKMDIEGAERTTLKGARKTIAQFKPKLAVCIYHLWDDPIVIPKLINEIYPDYRFYFKWVHLETGWEAVLFADADNTQPKSNTAQPVSNIDVSLTIENAQIAISKLNAEFEKTAKERDQLKYRYIDGGFLKKTVIYDWYLKLKGRRF